LYSLNFVILIDIIILVDVKVIKRNIKVQKIGDRCGIILKLVKPQRMSDG
jgi:hypothetical protein